MKNIEKGESDDTNSRYFHIVCCRIFSFGTFLLRHHYKSRNERKNWHYTNTGVITDKIIYSRPHKRMSDTIRPTVQYVVDDTTYEFTSPIGQSPRLRPGKKVGVYYNPNNPKQAMIDTFTQRGTISKFAGYIFIGFGLVFLYILLVQLIVE